LVCTAVAARRGLHRAHLRGREPTLRVRNIAQIHLLRSANPKVSQPSVLQADKASHESGVSKGVGNVFIGGVVFGVGAVGVNLEPEGDAVSRTRTFGDVHAEVQPNGGRVVPQVRRRANGKVPNVG
jgi:hypothetical protein